MDMFSKFTAVLFGIFILWMLYRYIRSNPESLSWANINKSFTTMGFLAIALIAFIAMIVFMLKRS